MKKIISITKRLIFLLWHDKLSNRSQKKVLLPICAAIVGIWTFPFQNLFVKGSLESYELLIIRTILTEIAIAFVILSLLLLLINRNRKYMNTTELTDDELNSFLKYTNESK